MIQQLKNMKKTLLSLMIILGWSVSSIGQNQLAIEIVSSNYKINDSQLELRFVIKNQTEESITIFDPRTDQFMNHFTMRRNSTISNQTGKAFKLIIEKEGECIDEKNYERPPGMAPRSRHATQKDVLTLAPNETSQEMRARLDLNSTTFCEGAEYYCTIEYQPKVKLLTEDQKKGLMQKEEALKAVIKDINDYLITEKLTRDRMPSHDLLTKHILSGNEILEQITPLQSSSERVKLITN